MSVFAEYKAGMITYDELKAVVAWESRYEDDNYYCDTENEDEDDEE